MLIKSLKTTKPEALYRVIYSRSLGRDHTGATMLLDPCEVGSALLDGENLVLRFDIDIGGGLCEGCVVLESLAATEALTR